MDLYYEGEAELSHVDIDEMAQCLGFTPRGQDGEYRLYAASGPFGAGEVKLYLRVLSQSPLVLEGRLEGLGTVNKFELSVAGGKWRFKGRQTGLLNFLGKDFFDRVARSFVERALACARNINRGEG